MAHESQTYPPSARCMLNEIVVLLFNPEATDSTRITPERVSALVSRFEDASTPDITKVKSLLSTLVNEIERLETRIELRKMEESRLAHEAMTKSREERRRALQPILEEERRQEGAKMLQKWLVQDQEVILGKIKSKELMTLSEFLEVAGGNKRAVSTAITAGRLFCIIGPDGQDYYPAFFADSIEYYRKCLGKVCQALKGISPYGKYQFLTTNNVLIGGQPLDAIHHARIDEVLHSIKYLMQVD